MVHVHLNQELYSPGDELKIAVCPTKSDSIQLCSVRCIGYVRLPTQLIKDVPNRERYAFKDKPIGPIFPDDSILLWLTPNFPIHVEFSKLERAFVRLYIPYFLPPSLKGNLFEICHYLEISILIRGEFEMRTKRIPLRISSIARMPKRAYPPIGDGYEQFDFSASPPLQGTPHGKRAGAWEASQLIQSRSSSADDIYKVRRTFRISFNNHHATEIHTHGEWQNDSLLTEDGSNISIVFRLDGSAVTIKRIVSRLYRIDRILFRDDQVLETCIWEGNPIDVSPSILEFSESVVIPRLSCPSFESDLVSVSYKIEFEIRAVEKRDSALDPVLWSLPLSIRKSEDDPFSRMHEPWPVTPLGYKKPIFSLPEWDQMERRKPELFQSIRDSEIDAVIANSNTQPGSMKFSIYSS
jgi:hypothetical protein